jgi:hypothetical protein
MPSAGFYNRVVLEHTSERSGPRRREAALPPRAECAAPCGARAVELSQARGRMTVSGADTHRDDRSPPWIYPGPFRARIPHVAEGCPQAAGVCRLRAAVR